MGSFVDTVVLVLFVFMLFMFVRGFNKAQIKKHEDRLKENNQKQEAKADKK